MDEQHDNTHNMKQFGLVGKDISYSFSAGYFAKKFTRENIANCAYNNFDIQDISEFKAIFKQHSNIAGLNVTIPYKESVIPYLDKLSKKAKHIGAVNTIKVTKKGRLKGYNTDCYGFKKSLQPLLQNHHTKALILGTGGASKAIAYSLEQLGIAYTYVSRTAKSGQLSYSQLTKTHFAEHTIIINCTPLGTFPKVTDCPDIPYQYLNDTHICYDLIYNPSETKFLAQAKVQGATIINGLKMLELQAEKAWKIWNS